MWFREQRQPAPHRRPNAPYRTNQRRPYLAGRNHALWRKAIGQSNLASPTSALQVVLEFFATPSVIIDRGDEIPRQLRAVTLPYQPPI